MRVACPSRIIVGVALLIWSVLAFGVSSTTASNKDIAPASRVPEEPQVTRTHAVVIGVALRTGVQQTISQIVSCAGERQRGRLGWQYTREPLSGYTIFPSREVVVAYLPRVCLARNGAVPETFTPLIVWMDDAASPSVIEFIVHQSYYERAKSPRVRITQLKVELSPNGVTQAADSRYSTIHNRFDDGHLSVAQGRPYARDLDSIFHGVTAYIYPEPVWRLFPALAQHLQGFADTTSIDWELIRTHAVGILGTCALAEKGAGPEADCAGSFDTRPYAHAMVLRGNTWFVDQSASGVERYFLLRRYDAAKEGCSTREKSCRFFSHRFNVSLGSLKLSLNADQPRFVFDPKTRNLILVAPMLFATRTMNGGTK